MPKIARKHFHYSRPNFQFCETECKDFHVSFVLSVQDFYWHQKAMSDQRVVYLVLVCKNVYFKHKELGKELSLNLFLEADNALHRSIAPGTQ